MREILFRGQTRKLGEKVYMTGEKVPGNWVYGGIFQGKGCYSVMYGCPDANDITGATLEKYTVYTDTVGQFTGLTDKNGTKIFEGDILKDNWGKIYKVIFSTQSCSFMAECTKAPHEYETGRYRIGKAWCDTIKVIGNIHDNPELIGGADNG